jgi:RNA recognition motif-containing protein
MAKRLLVEGLDWGVTDGQLVRVFSPFGHLDEARVAVDWETGRSRGFGYVTFSDSTDAEAAMTGLDGQKLAGKTLRVMVAPEQVTRSTYRGGDYGYADPAAAKTGSYRNADFDGSGVRKRQDQTDRKLFRSADFGYVEGERREDAADAKAPSQAAPAAEKVPAKGVSEKAAGRAKDPEESLDDDERANRGKYGGWREVDENDGGRGGGGNPFG